MKTTVNSPRRPRRGLSAAIILLAAAVAAAEAQPPRYTARFISPNFPAINAAAMNESGDVIGTAAAGTGGWVSRAGGPAVFLPLPPGTVSSIASDINEAGVIVGSTTLTGSLQGRATVWTPDGAGGYTIQQFGVLPGHISSGATAINNLGDIVGSSHGGLFSVPVLFTPGGVQSLSATGIFNPRSINDARQVLDVQFRRLHLSTMAVQNLGYPTPGYIGAVGEVINASGQAAGTAVVNTSTGCDRRAARYTDGVGWEIFSTCGAANGIYGMNDHGDVVMALNVAPYVRFEGQGTFLIEDLIDNDVGYWSVINGYGLTINNRRQMVVPASNQVTGQSGLILLTPVIACAADWNNDSAVNSADISAFITAWLDSLAGGHLAADFNGDLAVNSSDISAFIAAWLDAIQNGC